MGQAFPVQVQAKRPTRRWDRSGRHCSRADIFNRRSSCQCGIYSLRNVGAETALVGFDVLTSQTIASAGNRGPLCSSQGFGPAAGHHLARCVELNASWPYIGNIGCGLLPRATGVSACSSEPSLRQDGTEAAGIVPGPTFSTEDHRANWYLPSSKCRRRNSAGRLLRTHVTNYRDCGKPRSTLLVAGSGQRLVTTLPRV